MKRCSTYLPIGQTQIKTTLRSDLIKKQMVKKILTKALGMRKTNSLLMGMRNYAAAKKFSVEVRQMTGRTSHIIHYIMLSYMQRLIHVLACTHPPPHTVSSLFKTTRKWNQTERPSTWIDEEHVVYSNNRLVCSHREQQSKGIFRGREATEATINQKINIVRYCIFLSAY